MSITNLILKVAGEHAFTEVKNKNAKLWASYHLNECQRESQ